MSSSVSGCKVSSNDRDSSGEITEKNGFSVVAAIRVTRRFSTAGSSASCCVFENRCTSSMNSTVWRAVHAELAPRLFEHLAHIFDAGADCRQLDETARRGLTDHVRERGLAGAGRPPQEHRTATSVGIVDHAAQRRARPAKVLLPDHLVKGARSHADGEWCHCALRAGGRVIEQRHTRLTTRGARSPTARCGPLRRRRCRLLCAAAA